MNAFTHPTTRLVFALALCGACEWPMAQAAEPAPMPTDAAPAVTAPAAATSQSAGVVRIRKERTQAVQPQAPVSGPVAPVGFRDAISEGLESFQTPARPVTMTQAYPQAYASQGYAAQPVAMQGQVQGYPVETVYTDCPNGECDRHGYCKERFHEWLKYKFGYFIPTGNGGTGTPLFGKYHRVYPQDPGYFDQRDGQLYSAQGYGVPVSVPLAPVVGHQYNYGWGIPSSRLTPISHPAN